MEHQVFWAGGMLQLVADAADAVCVAPGTVTVSATSVCGGGRAACNLDPNDGCEPDVVTNGPCVCIPGTTECCYAGPDGTLGVGTCAAGQHPCNTNGLRFGACEGEVLPAPETCTPDGQDEDCNGTPDAVVDEDGDGWTVCNGDCCDAVDGCAVAPHLVLWRLLSRHRRAGGHRDGAGVGWGNNLGGVPGAGGARGDHHPGVHDL